jgi:uncharacterized protein (DUF342 family)
MIALVCQNMVFPPGKIDLFRAAADLVVAGSIVGKDRGSIIAGGDVRAKFITNAQIEARGAIRSQAAIANSKIICGGAVIVDNGGIVAGKLSANGGVVCRSLGNASGVTTVIEVGVDDFYRRELPGMLAAVEQQRAKAMKIEQTVQPLLQNQRTLTPAQKETATELLFNAQSMAQQADKEAKAIHELHASITAKAKAEVTVSDVLCPGVVIRFPGMQTRVMTPYKGPLKIALQRTKGESAILLIDPRTGSTQRLGAESVPDTVSNLLSRMNDVKGSGRG